MKLRFERPAEKGLIIISSELDGMYDLTMAVDTGATNTTIDRNALHFLDYDFKDRIGTELIETANGIVETEVFEVASVPSIK